MCTSSGQAASLISILNICQAGDSFIAASSIYGGTVNLFAVTFAKMGIECIFVDVDASVEELAAAFKPNTKAMFGETIANPALTVLDIENGQRSLMQTEFRLLWIIPLQLLISAVLSSGAQI